MQSEKDTSGPARWLWEAKNDTYELLSQRRVLIAIMVLPVTLLLGFILFLPILWAITAGFFNIHALNPEWKFVGVENYISILSDPEFWMTLSRSVVFAISSVALQLVVGTGIALLINKKFRFISLIRGVVLLPYLIPTIVVAYMGLWIGNSQWGLINIALLEYGFIQNPISFFGDERLAMASVIVVNSWKFSIFVSIMVLARLQGIPDGYYEAARMSGANAYQQFRDITLPNLKSIILIVLLLRGIWMFNKFDVIWILTRGGPGDATTTAPIYAYQAAFSSLSLGRAAAVSTFLFGLLVVVAMIYFVVFNPAEEVRVQ